MRPVLLLLLALLSACTTRIEPPGQAIEQPTVTSDAFVMADGARLPYRSWMPDGHPTAVVLALHGMNDSRDAWEYAGPTFAQAGMAVFAPDQRGFGATPTRGYWASIPGLVDDACAMARTLRRQYPGTQLILMGESMGAAVLMLVATSVDAPSDTRYVLLAPAVWGRAKMDVFLRAGLWFASTTVPGMILRPNNLVRVTASDNREALRRLSDNPLTIKGTRVDAARGLVDLMDAALASAPIFGARALFLYGGHDELVPDRAMKAVWPLLRRDGVRLAYYPAGYHLLFRDLERSVPIGDVVAWINNPDAALPSGADRDALAWLGNSTTLALTDRTIIGKYQTSTGTDETHAAAIANPSGR